jgi:hypothetical protein
VEEHQLERSVALRGTAGVVGNERRLAILSAVGLALLVASLPAEEASRQPSVRVVVGFEGSCPHSPQGVKREGPGRFRILPSWRASVGISEEAVGRSTRLGFKLVNESRAPQPVELSID